MAAARRSEEGVQGREWAFEVYVWRVRAASLHPAVVIRGGAGMHLTRGRGGERGSMGLGFGSEYMHKGGRKTKGGGGAQDLRKTGRRRRRRNTGGAPRNAGGVCRLQNCNG